MHNKWKQEESKRITLDHRPARVFAAGYLLTAFSTEQLTMYVYSRVEGRYEEGEALASLLSS